MSRTRICFIHIPKCGGTSIYNALKKQFSSDRIRHLNPAAAREGAASVRRGLEFRHDVLAYHLCESVDLVFGHYQASDALITAHPEYDFITLLREPVDRFLSNFYYNNARPEWAEEFGGTLEQFLAGPSEQPQSLGHNYVRFLGFDNPRESHSIEAAKRLLTRFAVVGITEKMDQFVAQLNLRYGFNLNVGYDNVTMNRRSPVSAETHCRIQEICAPNLALYEHAKNGAG